MPAVLSTSTRETARTMRPLLIAAAALGVLAAATAALWAHYGTQVFFEIVRAGWTACF